MHNSVPPCWFLYVISFLAVAGVQCDFALGSSLAIFEYDADFGSKENENPANMQKLVDVINRRLSGAGTATAVTGNKLRVEILQDLPEQALLKIRRSIETVGDLQFRITARPDFAEDKAIIDAAKLLPADQNELLIGGKKVAQWMPYEVREFGTVDQNDSRVVKRKAGNVPQALVLTNDGLDVTGKYIEKCDQGLNETGQPQVNFKFNDQGAFRFGQLTSAYSPQDDKLYALAIIFNGQILTAPTIRSKITHQGQITGLRDRDEVDFVVSILNAGSLPYPIRLIGEESKFRTWHEVPSAR
jgi:preprotein translocase subunit SecD